MEGYLQYKDAFENSTCNHSVIYTAAVRGHLQCQDTFSWHKGCPYIEGFIVFTYSNMYHLTLSMFWMYVHLSVRPSVCRTVALSVEIGQIAVNL